MGISLERFQNSFAPFNAAEGGIFLRKMPLDSSGFGMHQFCNRSSVSVDLEAACRLRNRQP